MRKTRLTVAVMFLLFLWGSTAATANAQISVSLPDVTGSVGQTVDVTVTIGTLAGGDNVTSYEMDVTYDPAIVDIVGFDATGMVASSFSNISNSIGNNTFRVGGASAQPVSGSGAFLTLEVDVLAPGQSPLTFDDFTFRQPDGSVVATTTSDGSVSVGGLPSIDTNTGITVDEGQSETIGQANLETEDTDHNPSELTYTIDVAPSNGTLMLLGGGLSQGGTFTQADINAGNLSYQHDGSETTSDGFDFTVEDPDNQDDSGTFTLTVTPVNDPPTLGTNAGLTVDEDQSAGIGQANLEAVDPDHGPAALTFTIDTPPSNGSVMLSGTALGSGDSFTQADINAGNVTYQHDGSETISDNFGFTVRDDAGSSATGTFDIAITPVNDAPDAQDDVVTVSENRSSEIDVLQNDNDPDGDPLALSILSGPSNGSAVIGDNGTPGTLTDDVIIYTPNTDYTGPDGFLYEVSDNNGGTDAASVDITVVENQPPAASDDAASTNEDTSTIIDVLANDSDAEGDAFSVAQVASPTNQGGTTSINPNGTIRYEPPADFFGVDTFTYTVQDVAGGSDQATVTVNVDAVNDPAVLATNGGLTVDEGATETINSSALSATDVDNLPADLTFSIDGAPAHGTLSLDGTSLAGGDSFTQADVDAGRLAYAHDGSETTSDAFDFTLSDGGPNAAQTSTSATFDITVTPVNDTPAAQDDAAEVLVNTSADIDVLANDSDPEGDPLTLTVVSGPTNGAAVLKNSGTPGDPTDDLITYTPDADYVGADQFTYEVDDGNGGTDQATVDINVTDNEPPVAGDDVAVTDEDTPVDVDVLSNDTDPEGGALTLTAADSPSANGGVTAINGGQVTYTPPADYHGDDTFTYTVSDDRGDTDQATVTVTIDPVNDAPMAADDNFVVNEDAVQGLDVLANDEDVDGDALTLSIITPPSNGTAQADNVDSDIVYSSNPEFSGSDEFVYQIEDGDGETDQATVRITIEPVNDPPVFTKTPTTAATEGRLFSYPFSVSDPDGDAVTVTAPTLPGWLSLDGGKISGTPGNGDIGDNAVRLRADDGNGGTEDQFFVIDVRADADSDGIADEIESNAPNSGDGNGDGTPDNQQENVASFPSNVGDSFMTVESEEGTSLVGVNKREPDADDPEEASFPLGYIGFTVVGLEEGADTDVRILLASPEQLNTYWKYGPTLGTESRHWYEFVHDGTTGAELLIDEATGLVGEIVLHLRDGVRGDRDLSANGQIVDPGAPGAVPNAFPEVRDDEGLTNVDTALDIDVLANDEDPDDDDLVIVSVEDPANGTAEITGGGTSLTYTPDAGFFGTDTFAYSIEDVHLARVDASVTVRVNALPVAANDTARAAPGDHVDIRVLANDTDPDADELLITNISDPASGTAEDEADTNGFFIRYTPGDDFAGEDTFTYEVSDGFGGTDSGTVVVLMNRAPSAADDEVVIDEDVDVRVEVLANDVDPEGDALTVTDVQSPTAEGGTAEIDEEGTAVHFTPAPDFFGTDSFNYTIQTATGETAQADVIVTVNAVNDAPRFEETTVFTEPADGAEIRIGGASGNASVGAETPFTVAWTAAVDPDGDDVQYTWQLAEAVDFGEILMSHEVGSATQFEIGYGTIAELLAERGVELGSSVTLHHRLEAADGELVATSSAASVTLVRGTITSAEADEIPDVFELEQNYPNPFNPKSTIRYAVPEAAFVELTLYNLLGNEVRTLVAKQQAPGRYEVVVDASDMASGIYVYRLQAGSRSEARQLVVLK